MLGYVKIYKPEMRIKDYEIYKGVYCSICKNLGRRFGPFARLTLSYDFTFLAILKMALDDKCTSFKQSHCSFNPLSKCCCCQKDNRAVDFASNLALIIFYYKVLDNIHDDHGFRKILMLAIYPFAKAVSSKARREDAETDMIIKQMMSEQNKVEKQNCDKVDLAAEPTAVAISKIASCNARDGEEKRVLERFGYCLGRWIYIIDAVDDYEKDKKSKNYNPFVLNEEIKTAEDVKKHAEGALELTAAETIKAYNLLDIKRFDDILKNVLFEGLHEETQKVITGKEAHKREKSI